MTRIIAPQASIVAGSLLFSVEIPGQEDHQQDAFNSVSFGNGSRTRSTRKSACEAADIKEMAQSWQSSAATTRLLNDVRALKRQGYAENAIALTKCLRELGYDASHVMQHASNVTPSALRLAHDSVIVKGCGSSPPLVVEPSFREHFSIGSIYTTERYRQLLAAIPEELVAPYSKLQEMVKLICAEMKFSFEATGYSLPPWRSTASVLSRWSATRAA